MEPEINTKQKPEIRVLKTATCPSLSGKSDLTYNIGCNQASQVQIRVQANSGTGYFSKDWIPQTSIQSVLEGLPRQQPITCATFLPIFRGKSINTSGFLLAVLKNEGLVARMVDNKRCYELQDPQPFIAAVNALLEGKPDPREGHTKVPGKPGRKPGVRFPVK